MNQSPANPCTLPAFLGWEMWDDGPIWRVCAYCDSKKAVDEEAARIGVRVSHGICPACRKEGKL